jgi:putative exosortase-associated protein (TIGR04073 family)
MKKLLLILLTVGIATVSMADFQAPPGSKYTRVRKLSRAVANLVYGVNELPNQWVRSTMAGGNSEAASYGTLFATHKILTRVGYGLYELVTFPFPTYKGGYRQPYWVKEAINPYRGYQEFAPEVGFTSGLVHTRDQVD